MYMDVDRIPLIHWNHGKLDPPKRLAHRKGGRPEAVRPGSLQGATTAYRVTGTAVPGSESKPAPISRVGTGVFPHKNKCGAFGDLTNETHIPLHPPSGAVAPGLEGLNPTKG